MSDPSSAARGNLEAPWRLDYLEKLGAKEKQSGGPSTGSFLRDNFLRPDLDKQNHVIVRTGSASEGVGGAGGLGGIVLLNGFPYSNGHLLVALGDPRPTLLDYDPAQRAALWRLTDAAMALMQAALEPQGVNVGINQGRAAGAGVPSHLHVHLVPRWSGDVNFITVVGQVRVIPAALEAMAERYRRAWAEIGGAWAGLL
jgi:ATP adenylyltransferase